MKKYTIELEDTESGFYESITEVCERTPEEILEDTLSKVAEILARRALEID